MTRRRKQLRAAGGAQSIGTAQANKSSAVVVEKAAGASAQRRTWAALILLVVISISAYALTLRNGFVTDDNIQILLNPNVKQPPDLGAIFGQDVWTFSQSVGPGVSNYYRPLQILVYSLEYKIFGADALGWHVVNLLLNAAVVMAAYFLIAALGGAELALWATLLFALHPMHVEAVSWVAALPELLCALLMMIAMAYYLRARSRADAGGSTAALTLSTTAFLGALFSKETALLFPAILFSYEYFYRKQPLLQLWRTLRWIWPYFAALAVYLVARLHALGTFAPLQQQARPPVSQAEMLLAVPAILERYIGKLIAPIGMNYFYAFPIPMRVGWWTITGAITLAAIVVAMFALRATRPLLAFSIAWILLTLAPALSLNQVGENFFTERYLFIPSLGFCVIVAWGWLWWRERMSAGTRRWVPWAAGCALLAFYTLKVEARIPVFRDDYTLLRDTVAKSPDAATVHAMLGRTYYERNDVDQAFAHLARAVELRPDYQIVWMAMGQYYSEQKRYDEAVLAFKKAVALRPNFEGAWTSLAKAYVEKGDWADAARCYVRLEELNPDRVAYYRQLAEMAERNGQAVDAIAREAEKLERGPADPKKLSQMADVLASGARWAEASAALRRAAQEDPQNVQIWTKLGICLGQTQDHAGSIDAYEHALALQPDLVLARKNLARALSAAGSTDESIAQFRIILEKNPGYEHADEVHYELGVELEKKDDRAGAAREYTLALEANPGFRDAQKRLAAIQVPTGRNIAK